MEVMVAVQSGTLLHGAFYWALSQLQLPVESFAFIKSSRKQKAEVGGPIAFYLLQINAIKNWIQTRTQTHKPN